MLCMTKEDIQKRAAEWAGQTAIEQGSRRRWRIAQFCARLRV
jgi:hypothetical protein